jgi:hypothetical protein
MQAVFNKDLKGTPARVYFDDGTIELNPRMWGKLSTAEKRVILLHEIGHYKTQSNDELTADEYALSEYLRKNPGDFYTPYNVLRDNLGEAEAYRVHTMLHKSLQADFATTGNQKALSLINKIKNSGGWMANFTGNPNNQTLFMVVVLIALIILLTPKK